MLNKIVSGIMLTLLLASLLTLAFNIPQVKASGTIYIRADGSVDPPTAPIHRSGNLYTLTANIINDAIVVERDNITLDGAGYVVQGPGYGAGVYLSGRSNVTIKGMQISSFYWGIYLYSSSNNTLLKNTVTANVFNASVYPLAGLGILLQSSNHNTILENNVTANQQHGIFLDSSSYNIISGNTITKQWKNSYVYGVLLTFSSNNNTIVQNNVSSNYYGVGLQSSSYNTMARNNVTANGMGISLVE